MPSPPPVEVNRARPNHAIWQAEAMAVAHVAYETLCNGMGMPEMHPDGNAGWCIRDGVTGAHLRVWSDWWDDAARALPGSPTPAPPHYYAAWLDGPRHPRSGRHLAEVMCGEAVGGRLELL